MTALKFGQVEAILAQIHGIASEKRQAFRSRLKHLQTQGLPRRVRPGRGTTGTFDFPQLMQLAIGVELIQAGMSPLTATQMVLRNWTEIRLTLLLATYNQAELTAMNPKPAEPEWLWLIVPESLEDLTGDHTTRIDRTCNFATIGVSDLSDFARNDHLGVLGERKRKVILNGTEIAREIILLCSFEYRIATVEELRSELQRDMAFTQELLDAAVDSLSRSDEWNQAMEDAVRAMGLEWVFGGASKDGDVSEDGEATNVRP